MLLVVTTAVRIPVVVGAMLKVTVSWVVVAAETVPIAPLLKVTVLLAGEGENPVPLIVNVVALIARLGGLFEFTVGGTGTPIMVATWTGVPLGVPVLPPKEFTTAVRLLRDGCEENVRVKEVAVAEVTRPVPLLKVTVLLRGVFALNPVPVMVRVVALIARLVVVLVTVGAATILAT
jgi:hypothetical protein